MPPAPLDDRKGGTGSIVKSARKGEKMYYVYIMTNHLGTLYIGVRNNLKHRVYEHKMFITTGFTSRYKITRLVYYENNEDIRAAIEREKQLKGWSRAKKVDLIESVNLGWKDLSAEWYR
jgi:putative endonuclease